MKNYLDLWTLQKLNRFERQQGKPESRNLTRRLIEGYQLARLRETFQYARENSPFYQEKYRGLDFDSFQTFRQLPFTTPEELKSKGLDWLCVPQSEISRIVTLDTSGTTGAPKRVYFTEEDQELTVDYFHHGMQLLVTEKDTVMILMPCRMPGSIGDLLKRGLERFFVKAVPYGLPAPGLDDWETILERMEAEQVTCVVALATHLAVLAEKAKAKNIPIHTVLLSAEYVSEESRNAISAAWGCRIFEHYGMTEMGLGGAVSCSVLEGYHLRESDLYVEIVDERGNTLPDGEYGEVVFSTLTRKGMPFLRYKTGDVSRWMTAPCSCGSILRRLDRVGDRKMKKGEFSEESKE